ncbi:MAG: KilA-N domain-containing protein [Lewinellaceae bacterium]|nr:KilA-N domain-containing protein [Saprospiraceae bacterium]MCB9341677.1 KilA-N domain-containing protein [Lewinellaceae bacterium]
MSKHQTLVIEGTEITLFTREKDFYVSITNLARHQAGQRAGELVRNWLRARSTVEFLGEWEQEFNQDFNYTEFDIIRNSAGTNTFMLSSKEWMEKTNAIGIEGRAGRHGGTYGHLYIALHFANWMNVKFYLKFIDGYVRMISQLNPDFDVQRIIARANFHLQARSVREHIVPLMDWNTKREAIFQASEADMLNLIIFGMTAKAWRTANADKKGNLRDHATKMELVVLNNLQAINAMLIEDGMPKEERMNKLLNVAATEMETLLGSRPIEDLRKLG